MPTTTRHAFGLVLLLLLATALSGCFRSAGGSLEPTSVAFGAGEVPLPSPALTLTPTGAAGEFEPTPELATEPPTPIPPSPTAPGVAVFPGNVTPTQPIIAMVPTNTTVPLPTPQPIIGPTMTFTSVPFNPLPPTPTFTQFIPPVAGVQTGGDAVPLGEVIAPPLDGQGGVEIAQIGTLSIPQMTSTAMIAEYFMTQAAQMGTVFPTQTPAPGVIVPLAPGAVPTATFPVAVTAAGICSEHLISPGENLFRLALRYGVTVDAIAQANNLVNPSLILAGDTLQIPCQAPATTTTTSGQGGAAPVVTNPGTYIVEPGDNLYRISIRFGVSMSALMSANGMTPATINFLRAGQQLVIP